MHAYYTVLVVSKEHEKKGAEAPLQLENASSAECVCIFYIENIEQAIAVFPLNSGPFFPVWTFTKAHRFFRSFFERLISLGGAACRWAQTVHFMPLDGSAQVT